MLRTLALIVVVAVSAVVMFVATMRLTNVAHLAFTDFSHPLCDWTRGNCDPSLVEDVKWTGIVLFASIGSFMFFSVKALFPGR